MADLKISAQTELTTVSGNERVPCAEPDGLGDYLPRYFLSALLQPHPGYIAGRHYLFVPPGASVASGTALGINSIKLVRFFLPKIITLSDLALRVTTLSVGGNVQAAIYASHATTFIPTGNPLASTGSMSTTSAAVVLADITGSNVTLQPGFYWAAANADNATVALGAINSASANMPVYDGTTTLANAGTASLGYSIAQTFGTWPDLTGASLVEVGHSGAQFYLIGKAA